MQERHDEIIRVRREGEPRFARVWYEVIDDPRLKTKAALTLYLALARIADYAPFDVQDPETEQPTGERGHMCFARQAYRSQVMARARIGSPKTFYKAMEELLKAGWVRRDYLKDAAYARGDTRTYRENWPPCYTLIRPVVKQSPPVHK